MNQRKDELPGSPTPRTWGGPTCRRYDLGCHPSFTGKSREFSTNTHLLERPQGAQRCLLCCGETPDARDIKSLVGSILPQRLELLATVQIPEHNGSIIPAARQSAAIRTHLERLDSPLMRFSHPHALPALHLPPAHHSVTASTEHQLSTGSPAQRRDHPGMARQGAIACPPGRVALPAVGIPHEELPTVPAAASRAQPGAIPAPGHATDPGHLRTTHPPWVMLGHVPHQHALQKGSAGQKLSIGTPGHAGEDGLGVVEVPQDLDTDAGSGVPQPDGIIPPGTCESAAIGTPRDAVYVPAMPAQHPGRRRTGHIPEGYQGIQACTSKLGAVRTPVQVEEGGRVALHDA